MQGAGVGSAEVNINPVAPWVLNKCIPAQESSLVPYCLYPKE